MPGYTTKYNFPYPLLEDAPNGPAAIQSLAEAVEARFDIATMPELSLRRTSDQTITAKEEEIINWQSATVNVGGMWTSGGSVTITVAGIYTIDGTVQFSGAAMFSGAIYVNGSPKSRNVTTTDNGDLIVKRTQGIAVSRTIRLAVNDVVTLRVFNADTENHDAQATPDTGTRLSMYWMRP